MSLSTFETRFRDFPAERLLAEFGETVTYTPSGGSATSITAIVRREALQSFPEDRSSRVEYGLNVWVSSDDVPTVVVQGDTVAIEKRRGSGETDTFKVKAILSQTGGMWKLSL